MRLRHVSASDPGWSRRRVGRGFVYLDEDGKQIKDATEIERIKTLVIPPAWTGVWICKIANGHLQCVGSDDAGRRQYLYHPDWRKRRDEAKFDRVLRLAKRLPQVREQVTVDLQGTEPSRDRVLAAAVRMLDLGYFRIGNDLYANENGSYGLTTLRREHVSRSGTAHVFCFTGKSAVEHEIEVRDEPVNELVEQLRTRRGGGDELLAFKEGRRWHDVRASDVNDYIRELFGAEFTAKDFRTWHATVLAAAALGTNDATAAQTKTAQKRAIKRAMDEVAEYLGNTPTIARKSYVDPRVIDCYEEGVTIASALKRAPTDPAKKQRRLERAVSRLLSS